MALTDGQENIVLNSINRLSAVDNQFIRQLESVLRKLERDLFSLLKANDGVAAVDVALARSQIENLLVESGYFSTTQNLLNQGYQTAINDSFKTYKELYNESFRFSDLSLQKINSIKALDFSQFEQLGQKAATDLSRIMVDMQFGNIDIKQAIESMSEGAINQLGNHATTWINTGVNAIARESSNMLAEDNGIKEFIYSGPLDRLTRPFCKQHIGKTKTLKEWNSLDNGQINPVSQYAGGFNCRHQLIGVR